MGLSVPHLAVVYSATTVADGRQLYRNSLAIIYDEVCRKEWHKRALRDESCIALVCAIAPVLLLPVDAVPAQACRLQLHMLGDLDFDVNVASLSRDKDLLERAKMVYNAGSGSTTSQNNGLSRLFARMCQGTAWEKENLALSL